MELDDHRAFFLVFNYFSICYLISFYINTEKLVITIPILQMSKWRLREINLLKGLGLEIGLLVLSFKHTLTYTI